MVAWLAKQSVAMMAEKTVAMVLLLAEYLELHTAASLVVQSVCPWGHI